MGQPLLEYTRNNLPSPFHPEFHPVFETLSYICGYALYRHTRARQGDSLTDERRWVIIATTAVGALLGSRVLGLLEQAPRTGFRWHQLVVPGGKTIVGGLLGGWLAVEIVKRIAGIRSRTGDLFAVPLCVGIAIGRVGCFLAGLADDTYGKPTTLPWGVNFGDGIPRHPTQVYEILFLGGLGFVLYLWNSRAHEKGSIFRAFMAAYLLWRLLIDFIKPQPLIYRLSLIQWACIVGLLALAVSDFGAMRRRSVHVQD